jgi:hypothetical protein
MKIQKHVNDKGSLLVLNDNMLVAYFVHEVFETQEFITGKYKNM